MAHGGARFTHANLLKQRLEYLAIEAQIAQEELRNGRITAATVAHRMDQFAAEVRRLSRQGIRHLELLDARADELPEAA